MEVTPDPAAEATPEPTAETTPKVDVLIDPLQMLNMSEQWVTGVLPMLVRTITVGTSQRTQDEELKSRLTSLFHARNIHFAHAAISLLPQKPEPAQALCRVVMENTDRVLYHTLRVKEGADYDHNILIDGKHGKGLAWVEIDKYLNQYMPKEMQERAKRYRNRQHQHVHSGELNIYVATAADNEWAVELGMPQNLEHQLDAIYDVVAAWRTVVMVFPYVEAHLSGRNEIDPSVFESMLHWTVPADWIIKTIGEALVELGYASRINDD